MKRNVLAGFRDVLLLPVTIVPLTVSYGVNAIVTGGTQAVNGLAMLNPQKWGGNGNAATTAVAEIGPEKVVDSAPTTGEADDIGKRSRRLSLAAINKRLNLRKFNPHRCSSLSRVTPHGLQRKALPSRIPTLTLLLLLQRQVPPIVVSVKCNCYCRSTSS